MRNHVLVAFVTVLAASLCYGAEPVTWEYAVMTTTTLEGKDNPKLERPGQDKVDEKTMDAFCKKVTGRNGTLFHVLNFLGKERWELMAYETAPVGGGVHNRYIFKRPTAKTD